MNGDMKAEATVTQLQTLVERDKESLAREIHDDLGGYLIASAMDVTNLRHRFAAHDEDARRKFERLANMLNGAIDMMRRVTEELRPTLLDNVGLFAALRWQIKHRRHRSSIIWVEHLPDTEPLLSHAAAISLYRVGQEALIVAENHPGVQNIDFTVKADTESLALRVMTDGAGGSPETTRGDLALGFLQHRVAAMGGEVILGYPDEGGVHLDVHVLLADGLAFQ